MSESKGSTYLITGGTGSFGKACIKELLNHDVKTIRIFSRGEFEQQKMNQELKNDPRLRFIIGDVRDKDRLLACLIGVDYLIHAAALKQVPTCEYNPTEAIKTNILGSMNVVECAIARGVEKVLGISSDKAVHPVNIYGATKLTMEKLFIQANVYSKPKTAFSCVRLGNIWGSRGSVMELWEKQSKSGEITLTHEEMNRFWITQEEIAVFSLKMLDIMEGGEIFIPKMKSKTMVKLASELYPDCKINIIGIREGERLSERLWSETEEPFDCDSYFVIK